MCLPFGGNFKPGAYTPRDYAKEGYINKGNIFGFTRWEKPETQSSPASQPSSMPQSSASSAMPAYVDAQQPMGQQQAQPASMPRATTNRFSFNRGSLRIGDSTMNSSDTGLNV
jgi:hypothetical protein